MLELSDFSGSFVTYSTSEVIHTLGLPVGTEITLNYGWDQLDIMFNDREHILTRLLLTDSEGDLEEVIIEGWIPKLSDIFPAIKGEN